VAVTRSPRPAPRPSRAPQIAEVLAAITPSVQNAVEETNAQMTAAATQAEPDQPDQTPTGEGPALALAEADQAQTPDAPQTEAKVAQTAADPTQAAVATLVASLPRIRPKPRPERAATTSDTPTQLAEAPATTAPETPEAPGTSPTLLVGSVRPEPGDATRKVAQDAPADSTQEVAQALVDLSTQTAPAPASPAARVALAAPAPQPAPRRFARVTEAVTEVVTRASTSGGRHWGINVGAYPTRYQAERVLLKIALKELGTLDEALRKVSRSQGQFQANFVGLSEDTAALACRRLSAQSIPCTPLNPS